jgi:hypothetical protein
MKNKISSNRFRDLAILIILFFSGSCLDYTVTTTVNRDGSIFRQYLVRGDSTEIFHGSLMVPAGSEWKISHIYVPKEKEDTLSEKTQYAYQASRTFSGIQELNAWLATDTSSLTFKPIVRLQKHFRWFYTYFDYSELYPMEFPFKKVPVDSFLTAIEQSVVIDDKKVAYSAREKKLVWREDSVQYAYSAADSLEMNKLNDQCQEKFTQWMIASVVKEYLDLLGEHFRDKQAVQAISKRQDDLRNVIYRKFKILEKDSLSALTIALVGDSLVHSDELETVCVKNPALFNAFDLKFKVLNDKKFEDHYTQNLRLPGKLFSTNSVKINQSELSWDIEPMFFFMKDYEMKATSRVSNPWIMAFTGLLALALVYILVTRRKK